MCPGNTGTISARGQDADGGIFTEIFVMVWKNDQVSKKETEKILEVANDCLRVEGDFVEMGCYKGDTSLLLAEMLWKDRGADVVEKSVEKPVKKLWIYDSFEGLPEKGARDESELGVNFQKGELMVSKREVKERFLRAGLPVPIIKKAWFNELTEVDLPFKIAFAFLDGDLYESIKDSLRLVEPRMSEGGVIMVHDYNNPALPGVGKAVDEWLRGKNLKSEIFQSMILVRNLAFC